jgi:DNA-directed RNA polymerase specialized sigma24 family protein
MTERTAIRRAMATLSTSHRVLIYQAYFFRRTTAEIAAELHASEREVRVELHEAMRELRRNLRDAHATV